MRDYYKAALIGACAGALALLLLSGEFIKTTPTPQFEGMDSDDIHFHFAMNDFSREIRGLPSIAGKITKLYDHAVFLQHMQVFVDQGCTFIIYGAITGMGFLCIHKYRKRAQASDTGEW